MFVVLMSFDILGTRTEVNVGYRVFVIKVITVVSWIFNILSTYRFTVSGLTVVTVHNPFTGEVMLNVLRCQLTY